MASEAFKDILKRKLGKSYSEKSGSQTVRLTEAAEVKRMSLIGTFTARAEERSGELDEEEISAIYMAAATLVDNILENTANEDIEALANQRTFRSNKTSKTAVKSKGVLLDKNRRVIKPMNLERLLNLTLVKYVQSLMGTSGRLNNRTGRLANSGVVYSIQENPEKRTASFWFTYMLYPYQVFEPGRRQGTPERSPKKLFRDAINLALDDLLYKGSLPREKRIIRTRLEGARI